MIISKTPYRISFVGGGTDLRSFYATDCGQVLSVTINKYLYVVVKRQIGIVEFKYRVNWSKVEFKNSIDEIEHPIVRAALRLLKIDFPVEITTFADIPAQTGLGSSSAFAVGLLNALHALKGDAPSKYELATQAAYIEIELLGRTIGKQDHFASAYGNFNKILFHSDETVTVEPIRLNDNTISTLEKNLHLFYTNIKRDSSEILASQNSSTEINRVVLKQMSALVPQLAAILEQGTSLGNVGDILHTNWLLKRSLTSDITNHQIDELYSMAMDIGARGGKLLGAGGGGFLLFYCEPEFQQRLLNDFIDVFHLPVAFDYDGTRIIHFDNGSL